MSESTLRESNYRGQELLDRLAELNIIVCGAGALGSNFIHEIMRQGALNVTAIDDDRVEEHNISTQMYGPEHVGSLKTNAIVSVMWVLLRKVVMTCSQELTYRNAHRELSKADLVIDTFDNAASRQAVRDTCEYLGIPCLHLGMSVGGNYGNAYWSANYVIDETLGDPCEIPATRNLISIVVAMGCEAVMRWLADNRQDNMEFTLRDMRITVK